MNDLKRDLFGNDAFEAAVLTQAIAAARRARRMRVMTRAVIVATVCLAALQLPFRGHDNASQIATQENALAAPASRLQVFHSKAFAGTIHTIPLAAERSLLTKEGLVTVVRTSNLEQPEIARINDDELLSLFQGRPVALVGRGANAELIFPESSPGN
jgi:hypothetical protein